MPSKHGLRPHNRPEWLHDRLRGQRVHDHQPKTALAPHGTTSPSSTPPSEERRPLGRPPGQHQHPVRDRPLHPLHDSSASRRSSPSEPSPTPSGAAATAATRRPRHPTPEQPRTSGGRPLLPQRRHPPRHGAPNKVTGCTNVLAGGDVDFDGTPYWPDWPNSTAPDSFPSTFRQNEPSTNGHAYSQIQFQTDAPASEATCQPTGSGCAGTGAGKPGNFYPHWTLAKAAGRCVWEFGQMTNGRTFGRTAQYGSSSAWFFGTLEGPIMPTPTCS